MNKQRVSHSKHSFNFTAEEFMITGMNQVEAEIGSRNDWNSEIKALDDTKLGVKGLGDAGVMKIPRIFIHPQHNPQDKLACKDSQFSISIIDLQGVNSDVILRAKAIEKIQNACEKWGFFQVVNHGINKSDLEDMLAGIRRFHEQDAEVKKELYSRDIKKRWYFYPILTYFKRRRLPGGIPWVLIWILFHQTRKHCLQYAGMSGLY